MTSEPIRYFNTAGICNPNEHYMIPAVPRIPDIIDMITEKHYFVIHAPRQSGKTTCLTALTERINSEGNYYALTCSLAYLRDTVNTKEAMDEIVDQIDVALESSDVDELSKLAYAFDSRPYMSKAGGKVRLRLRDLSQALDKDLVVFFDEADCLMEEPLIKFLAQIRDGYLCRSNSPRSRFPRAMALVGMRDIRDYMTKVRPDGESKGAGGSPFNVREKSLSLADFTIEEIRALYGQHTAETGQLFEPEAIELAWRWTEGQPWLINALAKDIIEKRFKKDYSRPVTGSDVESAARDMLLRNEPHFYSIMERLKEPRVRSVMNAVLIGAALPDEISDDDAQYVVDLGLLKADPESGLPSRPANPIYRELIVRAMTRRLQARIPKSLANRWTDGTKVDMNGLLEAFRLYWSENSEIAAERNAAESVLRKSVQKNLAHLDTDDKARIIEIIADAFQSSLTGQAREAFAHLVLQAFLQRVMNGSDAEVLRDYASGRGRVDLCVIYKGLRYPLELKIKGVQSREESLRQLFGYMDRLQATVGWLVVFDMDRKVPWSDKLFWDTLDREGKTIHVVGC
ncbi:MAG: ATP-binding protein [Deltaproteobacteria bacterium]|jgi:hypothetical protein|nr:ATP-binding protein [Deltaproteobacteria bacterium]